MKLRQENIIDAEFRTIDSPTTSSEVRPLFTNKGIDVNPFGRRDPVSENMLDSIKNVHQNDALFVKRDKGFLNTLFGKTTERDRRLEKHELTQTDQVCTFLEKKLALECEAIYLRCQDDTNNWLTRHRLASRSDLIDFATKELQNLRDTIEVRRAEYSMYLRRRQQRLVQNADMGMLYDAEVKDLEIEINEHLAFLRSLEAHFRDAIQQRIG